ncbi:MAG: CoA-binding protein, partial [Alphaproteobacteria bacterium]
MAIRWSDAPGRVAIHPGAMAHRLDPLLTPRSIAFVGASPRKGTPGNGVLEAIRVGGYEGRVYPVNPKYQEVEGWRCHPSLAALPERVDLAVLCVASQHLERLLKDAIATGAKSAAVFDSCYLENDSDPPLVARLAHLARESDIPVCGGNAMGYFNLDARTLVCGYPPANEISRGGIAFITHSGTAFGSIPQGDARLGFNIIVSSGQELATTAADYLDYVIELETTRVVALFIETVRDPRGFIAALERARARAIPVVALKVGRNEFSARLAESHSGAIAGNDSAYEALFDR